jgi:iron(III) transport system permease protein
LQLTLASWRKVDRALWLVVLVAALVALPILAIFVLAMSGSAGSWPANLPRLTLNSVFLCVGAGVMSLLLGTPLAWLVTFHEFPGRRTLKWMALLPLALPGYIISFLYVELLTYAGPVQHVLRTTFGWQSPQDYWFPEIRSIGGAAIVMAFALYPYVYIAALVAFMRQPTNQIYAARTLGRTPFSTFVEIILPQARPALFVGVLLVIMECLNDIGAATFFGVGTLTTAIYNTWLEQGDLPAAAQLASILILFMAFLVYLETVAKARELRDGKNRGIFIRIPLHGWKRISATLTVATPILLGFAIPVILLIMLGVRRFDEMWTITTFITIIRTLMLASIAAVVALLIALLFAYVTRNTATKLTTGTARIASLGYALPGTILGIGVLVPFGAFDQWINRIMTSLNMTGPGLLLSGSVFAVVFAYVTRFLIIAVSQTQDGMAKIPINFDHAARTLGRSQFGVFTGIHIPLLKPATFSAALMILVDTMKELPVTLILRPFDFETLATRVFELASLGQFESAAIPALLIVIVGLTPVALLARGLKAKS